MFYCIGQFICCIRSMSIFEWCAIAYCCTKTKTWCNTKCNELSIKIGEAKESLVSCCESIPDMFSLDHQRQVDDVQLAGEHQIDSTVENI